MSGTDDMEINTSTCKGRRLRIRHETELEMVFAYSKNMRFGIEDLTEKFKHSNCKNSLLIQLV